MICTKWHHQLNGCEFEQILWDGGGQGSLAYCSPWGHKESDRLNNLTMTTAKLLSIHYILSSLRELEDESSITKSSVNLFLSKVRVPASCSLDASWSRNISLTSCVVNLFTVIEGVPVHKLFNEHFISLWSSEPQI